MLLKVLMAIKDQNKKLSLVNNAGTVDEDMIEGNLDITDVYNSSSEFEKDNTLTDALHTNFSPTPFTRAIGLTGTARRICEPLWFLEQVLAIGRHGLVVTWINV